MGLWGPVGLDLDKVTKRTLRRCASDHKVPIKQCTVRKIEIFTPKDIDYYGDLQVRCPNENDDHIKEYSGLAGSYTVRPWENRCDPHYRRKLGIIEFTCPVCQLKFVPKQMYCLLIDIEYDAPACALYGITTKGEPHIFAD